MNVCSLKQSCAYNNMAKMRNNFVLYEKKKKKHTHTHCSHILNPEVLFK